VATIACLGWGSLVWNPDGLPIQGPWLQDGPTVCVEFLRQSNNGRITLVLDGSSAPVQSYWAMIDTHDIAEAVAALRRREGIPIKSQKGIGIWRAGDPPPRLIPALSDWANGKRLDAVIWTNLGPRFGGKEKVPTVEEVIAYLNSLTGQKRQDAEEYVLNAPVETAYRRKIIEDWKPT